MSGLRLDVSAWPLVITTIEGPVDLAGWEIYAESFARDVIGRHEPIVSVFDMSGLCNLPDARTRARIAEWSRVHEDFGATHHRGLAIVAPHPLARAIMKVLHWTVPSKVPTSYEADRASAIRYCLRQLRASGFDVTELESRFL